MVGGEEDRSPELAAVVHVGTCTGVLIAPQRLLTSAHCALPAPHQVRIAGNDVAVGACRSHPRYDERSGAFDLAVCEMESGPNVTPLSIAEDVGVQAGDAVTVAGFGRTRPIGGESGAAALRAIHVSVVGISDSEIVVGDPKHTACLGDSGGPVLRSRAGRLEVLAVVRDSAGAVCASPAEAVRVDGRLQAWLGGSTTASPLPLRSAALGLFVLLTLALAAGRHWTRRLVNAARSRGR